MSIHRPSTDPIDGHFVASPLPQLEVLFSGELPVLYVSETLFGESVLAYVADENDDGLFTLLSSLGSRTLAQLRSGLLSVREALEAGTTWMHWTNGIETSVWRIDCADLPTDHLPRASFMLSREHDVVFSTRAVGQQIAPGKIPASVVAFVAENTRKAFKTILDFKFERTQEGRPSDEHRATYDLPVQAFKFASFELDFAAPESQIFLDEVRDAARLLEEGLAWASDPSTANLPDDLGERDVALRAALLLTPPTSGPIVQIEVAGRWLSRGGIILDRGARNRVRSAIRVDDSEDVLLFHGLLEELDLGRLSCTLRQTRDGVDRKAFFPEEMGEQVHALMNSRVTIAGTEKRGRFDLAIIVPEIMERVDPLGAPNSAV